MGARGQDTGSGRVFRAPRDPPEGGLQLFPCGLLDVGVIVAGLARPFQVPQPDHSL